MPVKISAELGLTDQEQASHRELLLGVDALRNQFPDEFKKLSLDFRALMLENNGVLGAIIESSKLPEGTFVVVTDQAVHVERDPFVESPDLNPEEYAATWETAGELVLWLGLMPNSHEDSRV